MAAGQVFEHPPGPDPEGTCPTEPIATEGGTLHALTPLFGVPGVNPMSAPNFCQPCGFYHPRDYDCGPSRERDRQELRRHEAERAAWLDGYAAGIAERGMPKYPAMNLRVNHPSFGELELLRWGAGGREHFADPRPTDRYNRTEEAA